MESWIRKEMLVREDGSDLRITIGTRVCVRATHRAGKVTESGAANRHAAKHHTGTIASLKVFWD